MKKYKSTIVYGHSPSSVFEKGDIISITEKIDGSNGSFEKDDNEDIGISCYSRREKLDNENNLRGFYQYVTDNITPIKDILHDDYLYFGEFLCSHKVKYKKEVYNQYYLFAIWDKTKRVYLEDKEVFKEASRLGLETPEIFYYGEYISYEHLMSFVGKSNITKVLNDGEGIVIKGLHTYKGYNQLYSFKIVADKYVETKKQRVRSPKQINIALSERVQATLTIRRVEKLIFNLIDDGKLHTNYTIKDMGTILKLLGLDPYNDIMKEECEMFKGFDDNEVKKYINKKLPLVIKEILKEEGRV